MKEWLYDWLCVNTQKRLTNLPQLASNKSTADFTLGLSKDALSIHLASSSKQSKIIYVSDKNDSSQTVTVLLTSGTSAIAEELIYLHCKGDLTSKVANTNTSEIIQQNKGKQSKTFIIDPQRRMVMFKGGQWLNAEMIDGVLSSTGRSGQGFSTSEETIRISLNPVSEYSYAQRIQQRNITMEIYVIGTCQEVDPSSL